MTKMSRQTDPTTIEAFLRVKDMTETAFRSTLADLRITFGDVQRLRDAYEAMTEADREVEAQQRETGTRRR